MSDPTEQEAKAKAEAEAKAKAEAEAKAKAEAEAKAKPKGKKEPAETRRFGVTSPIDHNGESYKVGDGIELTQKEWDALKTSGAIGPWPPAAH